MTHKFKWKDGTELKFEDFDQGTVEFIRLTDDPNSPNLRLVIKNSDHDFILRNWRNKEVLTAKIMVGWLYEKAIQAEWPIGTYIPFRYLGMNHTWPARAVNGHIAIAMIEDLEEEQKLIKKYGKI
jgi:hypothetical protein